MNETKNTSQDIPERDNSSKKKTKKDIKTITKQDFIKRISENTVVGLPLVQEVYKLIEEELFYCLCESAEHNLKIRLFEGISIDAVRQASKTKINNLTGEKIVTKPQIKLKLNLTKNYKKLINDYAGKFD